jgi:hypothetical protein
MEALENSLRVLVGAAADALRAGLKPLLTARLEDLDAATLRSCSLPDGDLLAGALEAKARALLLQPSTPADAAGPVTRIVRCSADLRCVIRGARQAMQLALLVMENPANNIEAKEVAIAHIRQAARAALDLAEHTRAVLEPGHPAAAAHVAASYREVDAARAQAEGVIRGVRGDRLTSVQRAARAILWSVSVAGENMARVAARYSLAA